MPEYAIKNVRPMLKSHPLICLYVPADEFEQGKYTDRTFFYGVVATLIPSWLHLYIDKCTVQRNELQLVKRVQTKAITISDRWR